MTRTGELTSHSRRRRGGALPRLAAVLVVVMAGSMLAGLPLARAQTTASVPGTWKPVASMATARAGLATATDAYGRIYAIGGNGDGKSVEVYDPATNLWATGPTMPTGRNFAAAATGPDGRIYVMGGKDSANLGVASMDVYNPAKPEDGWTSAPPMSVPRFRLAAVTGPGPDGLIYAIGGSSAEAPLGSGSTVERTVEAYNPVTEQWSPVSPLLVTGRSGHGAAVGGDGRIYAIGGTVNGSFDYRRTVEAYDPDSPEAGWVPAGSMGVSYAPVAATAGPDGRIYALGGQFCNGCPSPQTRAEVYDPATDLWTPVASMLAGRYDLGAVSGPDGRIYAIGGTGGTFPQPMVALKSVEAYTPKPAISFPPPPPGPPNSWVSMASMTRAHGGMAATKGTDGLIYAFGRSTGEVYDPTTGAWTDLPAPPVGQTRSYVPAAATGLDGRVYVMGTTCTGAVDAYDPGAGDPGAGSWEPVAPIAISRLSLAMTTGPDGRIYAIGGALCMGTPAGRATATVQAYDPDRSELGWVPVASMRQARSGLAAAVGSDGRIYAIGGAADPKSVEAYDPGTDTWAPVAPMTISRSEVAAAPGPDGRIYSVGGYDGTNAMKAAEVYDPDTNEWAPVASMITARRGAAAAPGPDGRVYAIGGHSGVASMESYTPGPAVLPPAVDAKVSEPFAEYPTGTSTDNPNAVVTGSDGNIWFTKGPTVGRMTRAGAQGLSARFKYFPVPRDITGNPSTRTVDSFLGVPVSTETGLGNGLYGITAGPDGNLWFTDSGANQIGSITPKGELTVFPLPLAPLAKVSATKFGPMGITSGPDGNLWFTEQGANKVGRITPGGAITQWELPGSDSGPRDIVAGVDGNLWFTEQNAAKIGRISPTTGAITEWERGPGSAPRTIAAGPGGELWFTEVNDIVRMSPTAPDPGATFDAILLKSSLPADIAAGPDGNMWFTDTLDRNVWSTDPGDHRKRVGRVDPSSETVTEFAIPSGSIPGQITAESGPRPQMWFTEATPGGIGRIDITAAAKTYPPGRTCLDTGSASANFARTGTSSCTIASAGPLTHIIVSPDANCQVFHEADRDSEHYSYRLEGGYGGDGECGTFLATKASHEPEQNRLLYGPNTVPCYYDNLKKNGCSPGAPPADRRYERIDQRGVSGSGTMEDPYAIVTELGAGEMRVTQTDSYVVGRESYRTDVMVTNTGALPTDALLTRAGDCWLQNSDEGIGRYTPSTGGIACHAVPGPRMVEWTPISPGSHWVGGVRSRIWSLVGAKKPFPDACLTAGSAVTPVVGPAPLTDCAVTSENGAGINWDFTLAPGESTTRSHWTTFSPFGNAAASIGDARVTEPAAGSVEATFEVKLEGTMSYPITLGYKTVDNTATAGTLGLVGGGDYQSTVGTLTFQPGETSKTVTVPVLADGIFEPTEQFHLELTNPDRTVDHPEPVIDPNTPPLGVGVPPQNVVIQKGTGIGTIDHLPPPPHLVVDDAASVSESPSGTVDATFTVHLEGAEPSQPVTVHYATADGSATAGSDYDATSGTLSFAPGETTKVIPVPVLADSASEDTETFTLGLADPMGATIGRADATATILDAGSTDGEEPEMSIGDQRVAEPFSGSVPADFTVTLSAPSSGPVSVDYSTADASAKAGEDYVATAGRLEIPAGATTATISVAVFGDEIRERTEEFAVTLSSPTGASLFQGRGTGTIVDAVEGLSIGDATVTEGNSGLTPANFTVTLARTSTEPVSVDYFTVDATAVEGSDYVSATGTLNFAPGQQFKIVVVDVVADTQMEATEKFTVTLTNSAGAPIAGSEGTGTIVDNDVEPADEPPAPPQPPPVRASDPTPESGDPTVDPPVTPALVAPPLLVLAPLPPVPAPPQPISQPMSQAQAQQQAQQQNQQQQQQQQQQQAQQQAQAQAQVGMTAERQKETQVEGAYSSSTDSSAQTHLASALDSSRPPTAPVLGFIAALMAAGMALVPRNGNSAAFAHQRITQAARRSQDRQRRPRRAIIR